MAKAPGPSTLEEFIPFLQQKYLMLFNQIFDAPIFLGAKAMAALQQDGLEPKLCLTIVTFDVDMRRFVTISRVKEYSVWPTAKHGRHQPMLIRLPEKGNIVCREAILLETDPEHFA
jgi:hypothetical protein